MGFSAYAEYCNTLVQELAQSLSTEDIDKLGHLCSVNGWESYRAWCKQNHEKIVAYILAIPSRKKGNKLWQSDPFQLFVVLASIQYTLLARDYLKDFGDIELSIGDPYRTMAAKASCAALALIDKGILRWPFSSPDPFDSMNLNYYSSLFPHKDLRKH